MLREAADVHLVDDEVGEGDSGRGDSLPIEGGRVFRFREVVFPLRSPFMGRFDDFGVGVGMPEKRLEEEPLFVVLRPIAEEGVEGPFGEIIDGGVPNITRPGGWELVVGLLFSRGE